MAKPILRSKPTPSQDRQPSDGYTKVVVRLGITQADNIRVAQRKGMILSLTVDKNDYCWIEFTE